MAVFSGSNRWPLRPNPYAIAGACALILLGTIAAGCRTTMAPHSRTPNVVLPASVEEVQPGFTVTEAGTAEFVGSASCRGCHPSQFEAHGRSGHSHTMVDASDPAVVSLFRSPERLTARETAATHSVAVRRGGPVFLATGPQGKQTTGRAAFAVGSGRMGRTFIIEGKNGFEESQISSYPAAPFWDWTPGEHYVPEHGVAVGRPMSQDRTRECFLCHGTAVVEMAGKVAPDLSLLNVGCERCHGPAKKHLAAVKDGRALEGIRRLSRASGEEIMRLCVDCHRDTGEGELARFAGSALERSQCFKQSAGRLTCTSCHDPHDEVQHDYGRYERVCLSCHASTGTTSRPCPVRPRSGCISCHMPAQALSFSRFPKFHNHWIRARPTEQ